jgi:hypothetical protein
MNCAASVMQAENIDEESSYFVVGMHDQPRMYTFVPLPQ